MSTLQKIVEEGTDPLKLDTKVLKSGLSGLQLTGKCRVFEFNGHSMQFVGPEAGGASGKRMRYIAEFSAVEELKVLLDFWKFGMNV